MAESHRCYDLSAPEGLVGVAMRQELLQAGDWERLEGLIAGRHQHIPLWATLVQGGSSICAAVASTVAVGFVGHQVPYVVSSAQDSSANAVQLVQGVGVGPVLASWTVGSAAEILLRGTPSVGDRILMKLLVLDYIASLQTDTSSPLVDTDTLELRAEATQWLGSGLPDNLTPRPLELLVGGTRELFGFAQLEPEDRATAVQNFVNSDGSIGPTATATIGWTVNTNQRCSFGHVVAVLGTINIDEAAHLVFRDAALPKGRVDKSDLLTVACRFGIETNQIRPIRVTSNGSRHSFEPAEIADPPGTFAVPLTADWEALAKVVPVAST